MGDRGSQDRGPKGRGAAENPPNRFERLAYEPDPEISGDESSSPRTILFRDSTRSIVASNNSPDVGFDVSVNPYRGCETGCPYCYARPTHEYLGFSAGLDFESRIMVKEDAPELLRKELASPRWQPQPISMSGVTDPYQPIERKLCVTRRCLEVLAEFRNPVVMITKSALITRDVDLLAELARHDAAAAILSITTLDPELARVMEPRAATPERRLEAIRALAEAGIPVGVFAAPIIPALNDHEIPAILAAAAAAGATFAGFTIVRLPGAVAEIFEEWLERHRPDRKEKILNRLRSMRGGELNDSRFGTRMRGEGAFAAQIRGLFTIAKKKAGLDRPMPDLSIAAFRRPAPGGQLSLFE
jgi:DNA repair photolyase